MRMFKATIKKNKTGKEGNVYKDTFCYHTTIDIVRVCTYGEEITKI